MSDETFGYSQGVENEPTIDECADYITSLPGYDKYGPEGKARLLRRLGEQAIARPPQILPRSFAELREDGSVAYWDLVTDRNTLDAIACGFDHPDDEPVDYLIVPRDEA